MSHDLLGTEFLQPLQEIEDELASDGDGLVSSDTPALTERDAQRKHHSILESNRDINESKRAQEE